MKLLDTNAVQYVKMFNINIRDVFHLAPDVEEEVEITKLLFSGAVPSKIIPVRVLSDFDEVVYIKKYKYILNKYGGKSFFNMTGFGDISILATLLTLRETPTHGQTKLFQSEEEITVFTDDKDLTKKILSELAGKNVSVKQVKHIS